MKQSSDYIYIILPGMKILGFIQSDLAPILFHPCRCCCCWILFLTSLNEAQQQPTLFVDHINGYNEYLTRRKRSIVVSSLQLSPSTFQFCICDLTLSSKNVTYTFSAVAAVAAASRIANDKFSAPGVDRFRKV